MDIANEFRMSSIMPLKEEADCMVGGPRRSFLGWIW